MLTIRHILCPVDFSDFSRRALDLAFALAVRYRAEITALHVDVPSLPPTAAFPESPAILSPDATSMEQLRAELACFVAPSRTPDIPLRMAVTQGDPVTTILLEAEVLSADIIVMGTRGMGGLERWVLGSVAEKVLRKAPCPVLTVTRGRQEPYSLDPGRFTEVLCALQLSESSKQTLAVAVSTAQAAGAHLTLLHVLEDMRQADAAVAHAGPDLWSTAPSAARRPDSGCAPSPRTSAAFTTRS